MKDGNKEIVFITMEDYKANESQLDNENYVFLINSDPKKAKLNCQCRVPQLQAMHKFICCSNDESITMSWLANGVPDGANIYDHISISTNEELYSEICDVFTSLVQKTGWRC